VRGNPNPKWDHLPKGRQPGVPNKYNASFREALLSAFHQIGGAKALAEWGMAKKNRTAFYSICARLVPTELIGAAPNVVVVVGTGAQTFGPTPWEQAKAVEGRVVDVPVLEASNASKQSAHYQTPIAESTESLAKTAYVDVPTLTEPLPIAPDTSGSVSANRQVVLDPEVLVPTRRGRPPGSKNHATAAEPTEP
jgi:hypothetical protein